MAHILVRRQYYELFSIKNQLNSGTISAADAATMIGYITHDHSEQLNPIAVAAVWQEFEDALKKSVLELIEKLEDKI